MTGTSMRDQLHALHCTPTSSPPATLPPAQPTREVLIGHWKLIYPTPPFGPGWKLA